MTGEGRVVEFRQAGPDDWPGIWRVFSAVVTAGDTYTYPSDIGKGAARDLWLHDGTGNRVTYVAVAAGEIVGTAYLKPNHLGPGDHIANAGWMVLLTESGQGIGRRFVEHVLDDARERGFVGMQFNAVVATNTRALALWESMGFEIVGTVPKAFRHPVEGPVSIHIMYRRL